MTTYYKQQVSESDARDLLSDYRGVEIFEGGAGGVAVAFRLICFNPAMKRTAGVIAAAITLPILETVIRLYEENAALKAESLKTAELMLKASEKLAALPDEEPVEAQPDIQHKFELD